MRIQPQTQTFFRRWDTTLVTASGEIVTPTTKKHNGTPVFLATGQQADVTVFGVAKIVEGKLGTAPRFTPKH